ncbi:MAG TPA: FAD-binding protein [Labilithrix sp.]|nr:FAD-binding protein [Labilithrix sp.]
MTDFGAEHVSKLNGFPDVQGDLHVGDSIAAAVASDFGRYCRQKPLAVFRPATASDVAKVVAFARARGLPVAARGQGHSTAGQSHAENGIVFDMARLSAMSAVDGDSIWVGAGARWRDVVHTALEHRLVPPTLTDYLDLSVGGTLSMGGIGGETYRHGAQVDNVLELDVVTADGELLRCSPAAHPELFDACRAGLGQFAILCAARLRLVPAVSHVRTVVAKYASLAEYLSDFVRLMDAERFHHLYGNVTPASGGTWDYELVATRYGGEREPTDGELTQGLSFIPGQITIRETSYIEFASRVDAYVAMMRETGTWEVPHPWLDVFLRASDAPQVMGAELAKLTPDSLGRGGVLVYPLRHSRCTAPFLRLPDEEHLFLFDVLRNALPPTPENTAELIDANERAYRRVLTRGGTLYPIGSTPMRSADWKVHYGTAWPRVEASKRRYDARQLLTPGHGIFDPRSDSPATSR